MFFFFNDTATTEIYTLSLHDALPISKGKAIIISAGKVAFLRFQDFEVTNGPDLHVYMTSGDNISDRKSTRLNSSHDQISYAVFCLKKKIDDSDTHRTLLSSLTACLHN